MAKKFLTIIHSSNRLKWKINQLYDLIYQLLRVKVKRTYYFMDYHDKEEMIQELVITFFIKYDIEGYKFSRITLYCSRSYLDFKREIDRFFSYYRGNIYKKIQKQRYYL